MSGDQASQGSAAIGLLEGSGTGHLPVYESGLGCWNVPTLYLAASLEGVADVLPEGYEGEPFRAMSAGFLEASVSVPTIWRARHDRC